MNEGELFSTHLSEQMGEMFAYIAVVLGRYFRELIKNNVPEGLAGEMVLRYQDELLRGIRNASDDDS